MITMKELSIEQIEEIKLLFYKIFSDKPWNDDWSDPVQLHQYIDDLIGNKNSLSLGLFENNRLIGLSLGYVMHWCSGNEYYIFEFGIETERQGKGLGADFLSRIEKYAENKNITHIFLQTERTVPAYHFYKKNGFSELKDHISLFKNFQ